MGTQLDRIESKLDRLLELIDKKPKKKVQLREHGIIDEFKKDKRLTPELAERLKTCPQKVQKGWVATYGDMVMIELLKANNWLMSNPKRRGTARFFTNWLGRTNNSTSLANLMSMDLE